MRIKQMKSVHKITRYLFGLSLLSSLCFTVAAIAADEPQVPIMAADGKNFRVSYISKIVPLPLNRIHSWMLHVETLDSKPVEKADIAVYGGMPTHKHGLPTEPVVTEIGEGDYQVAGIKFSMNGRWQLWFNIRAGGVTEKIKFDIEL
jgi:hypothetical protein